MITVARVASFLIMGAGFMALPAFGQVYGPDGKELPPVSDPRPSTPSKGSTDWTGLNNRPWRIGVTAGVFVPIGSLSDRTAGHLWPSLTLAFEIRRPEKGHPYTLSAYLEGMATSRTFDNEFLERMNEVRELYGVGLEAKAYVSPRGPLSMYVGAGGGAYFLRRGIRYDSNHSAFMLFDDQSLIDGKYYVQPGYKFLFGFEERHGVFMELRYLDAGVLESVRYQGVSASIGGRF